MSRTQEKTRLRIFWLNCSMGLQLQKVIHRKSKEKREREREREVGENDVNVTEERWGVIEESN